MVAFTHTFIMIDSLINVLFIKDMIVASIPVIIFILCDHILPYRRADLASSALLQGIRGEGPQLHTLRLASAATLAREYPRLFSRFRFFFSFHVKLSYGGLPGTF
jgi:hypothetical protein